MKTAPLAQVAEGVDSPMHDGSPGEAPQATANTRAASTDSSSFPGPRLNQNAMNGETLRRTVTIVDPLGFHMRPLTVFAQRASQFQSQVIVEKDGQQVNGKSPLE